MNEAELVAYIALWYDVNVTAVDLSGGVLEDFISLMQQTDLLIGMHGSGLLLDTSGLYIIGVHLLLRRITNGSDLTLAYEGDLTPLLTAHHMCRHGQHVLDAAGGRSVAAGAVRLAGQAAGPPRRPGAGAVLCRGRKCHGLWLLLLVRARRDRVSPR